MSAKTIVVLSINICITSLAFGQNANVADFIDWEVIKLKENGINTEYAEWFPMILPDGLTLYFSSDRPGGLGDLDIYVTHRQTENSQWATPSRLDSKINSTASDHSVTISTDGHYMYFTSTKAGGFGEADLYFSYRENVDDDFGWNQARNLGELLNTDALEACPLLHQTPEHTELYYVSTRANGVGGADIYRSVLDQDKNQFQEPILFKEVSTKYHDKHFEPTNGFIWTDRKGGVGQDDIWIASYDEVEKKWRDPTCLDFPINTEHNEGMPSVTHDMSELFFHSDRPTGNGSYDIYVAVKK
jgi:hypothetical protein